LRFLSLQHNCPILPILVLSWSLCTQKASFTVPNHLKLQVWQDHQSSSPTLAVMHVYGVVYRVDY